MAGKKFANYTEVDEAEEVEYPFLTELATPRVEHRIDMVFVHGLNPFGKDDHPLQTWTHKNGAFWPQDFLPEDLPYARIFVYGYNSNVTKASTMSVLGIQDHAEGLLNLLNMERGVQQGQSMSKIIFVGHSLGGLVIKQALVIAQQNPMYKAIQAATFGLVFFGCPHHGAKNIELGKIAAGVAKFVSNGRASNDLLEALEHNSLFTRQVSDEFRHQLEDYQVVTFIEGKPMQMGGYGPLSASKIVVDAQSAVLGLSGAREARFMLDADHSAMCKIASKGNMYRIVKGNIKLLVEKAMVSTQGYVPPPNQNPSPSPAPTPFSPPLPPRQQPSSSPYSTPSSSTTVAAVIGTLYYPRGSDQKSLQLAELKNIGHWEQARKLEYEVFQERQQNLGPDHISTLNAGYDLACTHVELGLYKEATEWIRWVSNTNQKTGTEHDILSMQVESLRGEVLLSRGEDRESEKVLAAVLMQQQDSLEENNLDTLETQRRLAEACSSLGRTKEASERLAKRVQALKYTVGETHILYYLAVLHLLDMTIAPHLGDQFGLARHDQDVQSAARVIPEIHTKLKTISPLHPVTIQALTSSGAIKMIMGETTEASDALRRALSYAEKVLGENHPKTLEIVSIIGLLYMKQNGMSYTNNGSPEMRPWLERYVTWLEERRGLKHGETRGTLKLLALNYMGTQEYDKAQDFYEKLAVAYTGEKSQEAAEVQSMLSICQMNTSLSGRRGQKDAGSLANLFTGLNFR